MPRIAIVGLGLIGASFALALRKAGFDGELIGVSSPRSIEAGMKVGAISRGVSLAEAAALADVIYLSQPIGQILTTIANLGSLARANCLITDAGSTKGTIMAAAARHLGGAIFLGGHPMAGKESRGAESADAGLFAGRPYVLTPELIDSRPEAAEKVRDFRSWLERIGACVLEMNSQVHDETVAFTSHLPQLLSTALAATLGAQRNAAISEVFGPGLLDMTRLSLSAPEVWLSVLENNREAVIKALDAYGASLRQLRSNLLESNLDELFRKASDFASQIRDPKRGKSTGTKLIDFGNGSSE